MRMRVTVLTCTCTCTLCVCVCEKSTAQEQSLYDNLSIVEDFSLRFRVYATLDSKDCCWIPFCMYKFCPDHSGGCDLLSMPLLGQSYSYASSPYFFQSSKFYAQNYAEGSALQCFSALLCLYTCS